MALTQVSTGGIKDGQVHTADLADAQITAGKLHADALDHTYTLGASGTDHYTFTGEGLTGAVNDPTLYLIRGKTYRFVNGNSAGAHPFRIQTTVNGSAGTEYNTGVTNNGGAGGSTIVFEVPHAAPDVLYYQCTSHGAMGGILYITGALSDGSVTTAKLAADAVDGSKIADNAVANEHIADGQITTVKIADNNVTTAKILDGNITTAKIATNAVTGTKIAAEIDNSHITTTANIAGSKLADDSISLAKLEHGTSSNDGKFLRANNGADPTFETISIPSSFVTGMIIMWNSTVASIPSGWVLCDGNNSTPDLRDKFIVGVTQDDSGTAKTNVTGSLLQTGGSTSTTTSIGNSAGGARIWTAVNQYQLGVQKVDHTHTADVIPPFYALCFIMKT